MSSTEPTDWTTIAVTSRERSALAEYRNQEFGTDAGGLRHALYRALQKHGVDIYGGGDDA